MVVLESKKEVKASFLILEWVKKKAQILKMWTLLTSFRPRMSAGYLLIVNTKSYSELLKCNLWLNHSTLIFLKRLLGD